MTWVAAATSMVLLAAAYRFWRAGVAAQRAAAMARHPSTGGFGSPTTDLSADLARAMVDMCPEDAERVQKVLLVHAAVHMASRTIPDHAGSLDV